MGFGDIERRDDMSAWYPYGGVPELLRRDPAEVPDGLPSFGDDTDRRHLARWLFYVRDAALSAVRNMGRG